MTGAPPPDSSAPLVSVVIVNWNGAAHLAECLAALRRQTLAERTEIVVVDNGSTDGSREVAAAAGLAIRWLANDRNRGFAAGSNQGIRAARGEFVALLNNDAVAEPAWLAELVAAMQRHPRAGLCTSKVLSYFQPGVLDNAGHVVFADGLTRGRGRLEPDRGQFEREEEVFCASGCAALLRRAMLHDVGLFDATFFAYCEDADLGFRARLRGWRCVYVPTAVVYHKFSASGEAFSAFKAFHVERNRLWLAIKNLPLPLLLLSPAFTLQRYLWQTYGALRGQGASGRFVEHASRGALAGILLRAYAAALAGLPGAWRRRRQIQRRRRAGTFEVWGWLHRFGISARGIGLME